MTATTNPLLIDQKLPGRTFQLPSRGSMYAPGVLASDITDGEIHIYQMSALTEITLKNPDLLFNGKAIEAVFAECVPSVLKPLELYGRDVDAILFFLRLATYGSSFVVDVTHSCEGAKKHSYDINLEEILAGAVALDPTIVETARTVTVRNQTVHTRPIKFSDVVALFHKSGNRKDLSVDDIKELAIFNLMTMIDSVGEITNRAHIEEWVRTLSTPEINLITEQADKLNDWGISNVTTVKCRDCGTPFKIEIPLNPINFFTE